MLKILHMLLQLNQATSLRILYSVDCRVDIVETHKNCSFLHLQSLNLGVDVNLAYANSRQMFFDYI